SCSHFVAALALVHCHGLRACSSPASHSPAVSGDGSSQTSSSRPCRSSDDSGSRNREYVSCNLLLGSRDCFKTRPETLRARRGLGGLFRHTSGKISESGNRDSAPLNRCDALFF